SVIAADEVEAEIDRRGGSGRGQQLSFVDEEDVLVDLDRGEASAEFLRRRPVCGGPPSAEQTGAREYEGARRDRGDPRSALEGRQQRADDRCRRFLDHRRGGPGQDDRIRARERLESVVDGIVQAV